MNLKHNLPFISSLENFGIIQLSGDDSLKFLQGQITTNSDLIETDQLTLSAMCNPQGRCIAIFFITRQITNDGKDNIWLIIKKNCIDTAINNLKKYAVFSKVAIEDVSNDYHIYGLKGDYANDSTKVAKVKAIAHQSESTLSLMIAQQEIELTEKVGLESDWLYCLAENNIPWLEQDSQSQFLPHNLNLPELQAVDFKKGCFTGQEVIARMQYKGKLKSHMQQMTSSNSVKFSPSDKVYADDKVAGELICGSINQSGQTLFLALLKDRYLNTKSFHLGDENGPILRLTTTN